MNTKLLIVIGIIIVSIGSGTFFYFHQVLTECESILGDTHYPRPLTFWNCFDYLQKIDNPPPKSISEPEP